MRIEKRGGREGRCKQPTEEDDRVRDRDFEGK